jgi:hypothetical protein
MSKAWFITGAGNDIGLGLRASSRICVATRMVMP